MLVNMSCGKRTQKSNISRHRRTCQACVIVQELQKRIEHLETSSSSNNESCELRDLRDTNARLYQTLHEKNELIEEKNREIHRLLQRPQIVHVDNKRINVNHGIQNVAIFGQEPRVARSEVVRLFSNPSIGPRYIRLKHFVYGHGNIRITNERGPSSTWSTWMRTGTDAG